MKKLSISQLAALTSKSRDTVSRALESMQFEDGPGGGKLYKSAPALEAIYFAGDEGAGELEKQQIRWTKAKADAQELQNEKDRREVVPSEFAAFALSGMSAEIASILDTIPLNVSRRFPDLEPRHIDFIELQIAKSRNIAASLGDKVPELIDEYNNMSG